MTSSGTRLKDSVAARVFNCNDVIESHGVSMAPRTLQSLTDQVRPVVSKSFLGQQLFYIDCFKDTDGQVHVYSVNHIPTPKSACTRASQVGHPKYLAKHPEITKIDWPSVSGLLRNDLCSNCFAGAGLTRIIKGVSIHNPLRIMAYLASTVKVLDAMEAALDPEAVLTTQEAFDLSNSAEEAIATFRQSTTWQENSMSPYNKRLYERLSATYAAFVAKASHSTDLRSAKQRAAVDKVRVCLTPRTWTGDPLEFDETPVIIAFAKKVKPGAKDTASIALFQEFSIHCPSDASILALPRFCAEYLTARLDTVKQPLNRDTLPRAVPRIIPHKCTNQVLEVAASLFDPHARGDVSDISTVIALAVKTLQPATPQAW
jgi:hypothetical protein